MGDFDWLEGALTSEVSEILAIAVEESRRRGQFYLGVEHIFWAIVRTDLDTIGSCLTSVGLSVDHLTNLLEQELNRSYTKDWGNEIRVTPRTERVLRMALELAQHSGESQIYTKHLLQAILEEGNSIPVRVLKENGVAIETVASRLGQTSKAKPGLQLPRELADLCDDITLLAETGETQPILGREEEIRRISEILLTSSGPANPLLVGKAGVGKTAIVEGLAQQIVSEGNHLPKRLKGCRIFQLRMNAVIAGTPYRGTLEHRMEALIAFFRKHKNRAILFIDEIHQIVGAGKAIGAPIGIGQILLAPLGRGELRLIGATTPGRYKESIRDDDAMRRRFSAVQIHEPSQDAVKTILYSVKNNVESEVGITITDDAIEKSLELSPRYERWHQLPDKAKRWLVQAAARAEYEGRKETTEEDVVSVVSGITKIPEYIIWNNPKERCDRLNKVLKKRVIGQDPALDDLSKRVTSRLTLPKIESNAPYGVFVFLGPTGVGKTETAKALAEFLFGKESRMVRLNMSEYIGGDAVSRLIGHGRGIVGAERGGILTEQILDDPHTILLLDELEKAHREVLNLFLQVFDEGVLTDGMGNEVYFTDAIIIMTSNLGSEVFADADVGFPSGQVNNASNLEEKHQEIRNIMKRNLSPEFVNRIDGIIVFNPLSRESAEKIVALQLAKLNARFATFDKRLCIEREAINVILQNGYSQEFGARELARAIETLVLDDVATHWEEASEFNAEAVDGSIVVRPKAISMQAKKGV